MSRPRHLPFSLSKCKSTDRKTAIWPFSKRVHAAHAFLQKVGLLLLIMWPALNKLPQNSIFGFNLVRKSSVGHWRTRLTVSTLSSLYARCRYSHFSLAILSTLPFTWHSSKLDNRLLNHSDCCHSLHVLKSKTRNVPRWLYPQTKDKSTIPSLPHAQERTLYLTIVVGVPESALPEVLAIHTIEMIPNSMSLQFVDSVLKMCVCPI